MAYIISAVVAVVVVISAGFGIHSYYTRPAEPIDIEIVESPEVAEAVPDVKTVAEKIAEQIKKTAPKPKATRTATPSPTPTPSQSVLGGDQTPPTIGNVRILSITSTSAVINWGTNEAADTQVEYGPLTTYGSLSSLNSNKTLNHSVELIGLTQNRTYHVRVRSRDAVGNLAVGSDYSFDTLSGGTAAEDAPEISDVEVDQITSTSARVRWSTDIEADGKIEYGVSTSYASSTTHNGTTRSHTITLSNLLSDTSYHYRVRSKTSSTTEDLSNDRIFRTAAGADTTAPTFQAITVTDITQTSARISWSTNEASDAAVEWGLADTYGTVTSNTDAGNTSHSVTLSGLEAGKTYHYRVRSKDAANNTGRSSDATFTTVAPPPVADTTAPTIENVQTTPGTDKFTVTWTTNEAADSLVRYTIEGQDNWGEFGDAAKVTSHNMTVNDRTPGTTYTIEIYSTDAANNKSEKVTRTVQTMPAESPAPEEQS
jgi:hypothetical protein